MAPKRHGKGRRRGPGAGGTGRTVEGIPESAPSPAAEGGPIKSFEELGPALGNGKGASDISSQQQSERDTPSVAESDTRQKLIQLLEQDSVVGSFDELREALVRYMQHYGISRNDIERRLGKSLDRSKGKEDDLRRITENIMKETADRAEGNTLRQARVESTPVGDEAPPSASPEKMSPQEFSTYFLDEQQNSEEESIPTPLLQLLQRRARAVEVVLEDIGTDVANPDLSLLREDHKALYERYIAESQKVTDALAEAVVFKDPFLIERAYNKWTEYFETTKSLIDALRSYGPNVGTTRLGGEPWISEWHKKEQVERLANFYKKYVDEIYANAKEQELIREDTPLHTKYESVLGQLETIRAHKTGREQVPQIKALFERLQRDVLALEDELMKRQEAAQPVTDETFALEKNTDVGALYKRMRELRKEVVGLAKEAGIEEANSKEAYNTSDERLRGLRLFRKRYRKLAEFLRERKSAEPERPGPDFTEEDKEKIKRRFQLLNQAAELVRKDVARIQESSGLEETFEERSEETEKVAEEVYEGMKKEYKDLVHQFHVLFAGHPEISMEDRYDEITQSIEFLEPALESKEVLETRYAKAQESLDTAKEILAELFKKYRSEAGYFGGPQDGVTLQNLESAAENERGRTQEEQEELIATIARNRMEKKLNAFFIGETYVAERSGMFYTPQKRWFGSSKSIAETQVGKYVEEAKEGNSLVRYIRELETETGLPYDAGDMTVEEYLSLALVKQVQKELGGTKMREEELAKRITAFQNAPSAPKTEIPEQPEQRSGFFRRLFSRDS